MNQRDTDLIDAFLRGSISDEEKAEFQNKLDSDPEFRESFNFMQTIQQTLRLSVLEDKLKILQDTEQKTHQSLSEKGLKSNSIFKWIIVAVVAGVGLFAYFKFKENKDVPPVMAANEERVQNTLIHKTVRSNAQASILSNEQKIAYDLYAIAEFKEAIPRLKQLWEKDRDTLAYFYLGASYFFSGKQSEANEIFSDAVLKSDSLYSGKIQALMK